METELIQQDILLHTGMPTAASSKPESQGLCSLPDHRVHLEVLRHGESVLSELPDISCFGLACSPLVVPRGVGMGGGKAGRLISALLWDFLNHLRWKAGETGEEQIKPIPSKRDSSGRAGKMV